MTPPFVSAEALLERIGDPDLRIVDLRWYLLDPDGGADAYAAGHLPGAIFVDLERDLTAADGPGRHPLPERGATAATLGNLGIGDDHFVVVYDDAGGAIAARLWWMLRDLGHETVAILDGGIQAWHRAGGPISKEVVAHHPTRLTVRPSLTRTVERGEIESGTHTLVDARAPERFRGETEPVDAAAGHIPGAVNVPFADLLSDDWTLHDPSALASRLDGLEDDVVVYCGSGVTSCLPIAVMVSLDMPEPALYPGSWSDWSSGGGPVETGG